MLPKTRWFASVCHGTPSRQSRMFRLDDSFGFPQYNMCPTLRQAPVRCTIKGSSVALTSSIDRLRSLGKTLSASGKSFLLFYIFNRPFWPFVPHNLITGDGPHRDSPFWINIVERVIKKLLWLSKPLLRKHFHMPVHQMDRPEKAGRYSVVTDINRVSLPDTQRLYYLCRNIQRLAVRTGCHHGDIWQVQPCAKDTRPVTCNPVDTVSTWQGREVQKIRLASAILNGSIMTTIDQQRKYIHISVFLIAKPKENLRHTSLHMTCCKLHGRTWTG